MSGLGLMGPLVTIVFNGKVEGVPDFYTWANGMKLVKHYFILA